MPNKLLPPRLDAVLTHEHADAEKILFYFEGDLLPDESPGELLLAFDADTLYTVTGSVELRRVDRARRLETVFSETGFSRTPLDTLRNLRVERQISTSRLIADTDGAPAVLAVASIGRTKAMENFARAFNGFLDGETPQLRPYVSPYCPVCGMPYPEEGRRVCPNCSGRVSITMRLLGYFKDYGRQVSLIILTMFLASGFSLLTPYVGSKLLYDEVLVPDGRFFGMVLGIVALIFAVRLANTLMNVLYTWVLGSIMPWVIYDLKLKIFTAMQRLSTGYYTSKQTGALMTRVNRDANNIYWFFVDGVPYLVVNSVLFVGVAAFMLSMSWKLSLIAIAAIPLVLLFFKIMWKVFQPLHHRLWVHDSRLSSVVSDTLSGQRVIKAFSKESAELSRFDAHSGNLAAAEIRLANMEATSFPLVYLVMFAAQVIITAAGGVMVLRGELTLGTLIAFIAYMGILYGPLEFMSRVSNWWSRCVDSAQRVFEIIDSRPDIVESEHPVPKTDIDGKIEFDHVRFEYEPARPVLRDMSFTVEAGQMLGIVGKAGAGKSTMANLMARLYDPTEGVVRIDGVDIRELPMALVRRNIGIVSQEIYLFIGSIADNIRYAKPDAPMEEVIAAAKAAGAHDFIMRLPDAYETRVGAGGQDLSGGERQRLSIARVIIQNPKILILDEATAAMDTETERKIQNSVNALKSGRTTIAIAHRLSTLRDADTIAVISDGRVVEYGRHDELIRKKGEFYKLYTIQTEALKYTGIGV
ncbi:MAG: ABC transporter ATP-binding protein [Eubacteriales bacterium]|nr:ABC transporter ATP-binding protein [Eubacteriales bacterium]